MLQRRTVRANVAAGIAVLLAAGFGLIGTVSTAAAATSTSITVDGSASGRTFDGVGAISGGGGNSRLLIDYPTTQRSQVLDYLFKQGYGAAAQVLKVEIGGDANSTDGAEPSIEHTQGHIDCNAGYEWWLMDQAKARNSSIKFYGLAWAAPGWVGTTYFTPNAITYILDWLGCAKSHGDTISYLGGWNERGWDKTWYENLRAALNSHGYSSIKIVAADNDRWAVADDIVADPAFAKAVDIIGAHYPCGYLGTALSCTTSTNAVKSGKKLWASENGSQDMNSGAAALVRDIVRGYLDSKMTAYLNWPVVAALYPNLPFPTVGLAQANQPWSGHYTVGTSLWTMAQFTQFIHPGWNFLDSGSGFLGGNRTNGSYVSLRSTNKLDYSAIVETSTATASQTATFHIKGGLSTGTVHVWSSNLGSTNSANYMVHSKDITPVNGTFTLTLQPNFVYSITTTAGQGKGTATSPAATALPLPYSDNFDSYATGTEAKYLSDMQGAFEVEPCTNGRTGQCVQQLAPTKPLEWSQDADAFTLVGDTTWRDYTVSVDVNLQQAGTVEVDGRANTQLRPHYCICQAAYLFRVSNAGAWSIVKSNTDGTFSTLTSGTTSALGTKTWHKLSVSFVGTSIKASVDGHSVGSVSDSSYATGQVAFGLVGYATDEFDNLSVTPIGGPTGPITSAISGKCVDDTAGSSTDGTKVELWTCNGKPAPQSWTVEPDGSLQINGKCMDVTGKQTADGTPVEIWTCTGGTNQKWTPSGGELISAQSGKCLDAPATTDGTQLDIRTCTGSTNQKWTLP